jgi:hypothetical protein
MIARKPTRKLPSRETQAEKIKRIESKLRKFERRMKDIERIVEGIVDLETEIKPNDKNQINMPNNIR